MFTRVLLVGGMNFEYSCEPCILPVLVFTGESSVVIVNDRRIMYCFKRGKNGLKALYRAFLIK